MEDGARHHLAECSDLLDAEVLAAKVGWFPDALLSRHNNREPVSVAKNAPNLRPATDDGDHRFTAGPHEIQPSGDTAAQRLETGFKRRQFNVDPLLIEVAEFFRDVDADVGQIRRRDRHPDDKRPPGSLGLRNTCRC
jgi:hypothetical protein